MTPALRRAAVATLFGSIAWSAAAPLQAAQIRAGGIVLRYDDTVWRATAGLPPVLVTLDCIAALCSANTSVTILADPRPFPQPGAGGFTPGAVSALLVDLRVQNLTPGARLRPTALVETFARGGNTGYRSRYLVEDRELQTTSLVNLMIRHRGAAVHLRLTGPTFKASAAIALSALAAGLSFDD